jgi:glycosyltransferase involved in cell wall biosynthesis
MTPGQPAAAPLVSFIVPTFNSQATLARALQSLADQTCRDFEVVLSDGASSDDSVRVAQGFAPVMPSLQIDSRPDQGVYDAINRAIARARGDWIFVLGSDDRLHAPDTLASLASALRTGAATIVHGDVIVTGPSQLGVPVGGRYAGPMTLERLLSGNVCQQAIFYRRTLFAELGLFNLRYPVWADWDFNLRAAFRAPMQWVDVVVSDYATTGMSSTRSDPVFGDELPELIRRELASRPHERALWPLQRRLRRQAKELRRRGHWSAALRQWGTYAVLMAKRVMAG